MSLVSFDGGVRAIAQVVRPDHLRQIERMPEGVVRIVRGAGYSYAAAGFGGGALVVDGRAFDRVLAFDAAAGRIRCEAGTTLARIHEVAAPHGWYLPVQPGYPLITVGGCVAADVHGKNHWRDGTFARVVEELTLFHPAHGVQTLDPKHGTDLFRLTCGGFGLTGHILSATLRLSPLPSTAILARTEGLESLEDAQEALARHASDAELVYTWHDLALRGARFGAGTIHSARFGQATGAAGRAPGVLPKRGITAESRARPGIRFFGGVTTALFNRAYHAWLRASPGERILPLRDFLFPVSRRTVYFRLFGREGFHEVQLLLPSETFRDVARELRRGVARLRPPLTLASCKLFRGTSSHVRFDGSGVCLALDFPRSADSGRFAEFLDEIACEANGRPNLAKDSRLSRAVAERCIPEIDGFREALARFDPRRLYRSELSERLGL